MCDSELLVDEAWADFDQFIAETSPKVEQKKELNCVYFCKCGGTKVFGFENLQVCTTCGTVDGYYIDDSAEWTSGVSESGVVSDPGRCGMHSDTELFSAAWGAGLVINSRGSSYAVRRMAKVNFHSSMNHKDRALFHAYKDIELAALTRLNLPATVIRDAKVMYKKFNGEKLTRGAVRSGIKANCVLTACKLANVPRTTKEVADAFEIPSKDISRTSQMFRETLLGGTEETTKITKARDVLPRIFNDFMMLEETDKRKIASKCRKMCSHIEPCVELMGKTPNSIASAVILIALEGKVSKADVASTCKISMPTLNKIEGVIRKYLEENKPTW
jgi:transcription initiation factor TFIIIB Brf1 subunit/transcription initiation factor TFIIB